MSIKHPMKLDKILFISLIFLLIHGYGTSSTTYGNYILSFLFTGTIIIFIIYTISRALFKTLSFFLPFPFSIFRSFIPVFLTLMFLSIFFIIDFTVGSNVKDFRKCDIHSKEFYYNAALTPIMLEKNNKYRFYGFFMNKSLSRIILKKSKQKISNKTFNNIFLSFLLLFSLVILSCGGIGVFKLVDSFILLNIFTLIIV